ncbi:AbiH family protein [Parvimonas micra]|uniref:AbiH family protein n=1 Tax=Parvimonas micra TaxID=33033 RepID=UPI0030D4E497
MFKKYHENYYGNSLKKFKKQHNILVLVGNGFDISVLMKYKKGRMEGKTTSYSDFFDYITYFNLVDENNILYKKMKEDKEEGKKNWSDFENTISELDIKGNNSITEIESCIDKFQELFTRFLNELVDANTLLEVNKGVSNNNLAIQSFEKFLMDLQDIEDLKFIKGNWHYNLYYFLFFNFNYTSLLDNYIYLDKHQFDPHCYTEADRNYQLKYKLNCYYTTTSLSSYLIYDIIHPHGVQDIPRSILFGIDLENYDKGKSKEKRLVKSYWAQYDIKYKSYFTEAELFIIYGMSLGKTDAWWMDSIYEEILKRDVELIIYKHGNEDKEIVIELFFDCCVRHTNSSEDEKNKVKSNIHVVTFTENNTYFLGLEEK